MFSTITVLDTAAQSLSLDLLVSSFSDRARLGVKRAAGIGETVKIPHAASKEY